MILTGAILLRAITPCRFSLADAFCGDLHHFVADITCIPTWADFRYRAVVLDVRSRRIVGWPEHRVPPYWMEGADATLAIPNYQQAGLFPAVAVSPIPRLATRKTCSIKSCIWGSNRRSCPIG